MVKDKAGASTLLSEAISNAQRHLFGLQNPDGYWVGELIVDSTLCSDLMTFMYWSGDIDLDLQQKCIEHILARRLPDGGWNIYPEGPSEVNASVKAYLSLKLAGYSADDPMMVQTRERIHQLGGMERTNTYARLYLALLGQVPWEVVPSIPVEFLLLPKWLPIHMHAVSSWTRAMIVPLAIINHYKPTRQLPPECQISELFLNPEVAIYTKASGTRQLFLALDRWLKRVEQKGSLPWRRKALQDAESWMLQRIGEGCGGLAAIFPAILNSMIALRCLGYDRNHPVFEKAESDFRELFVEDEEGFRIQPCLSPVWDTAITVTSLARSGITINNPSIKKAIDWLLAREVRIAGDWVANVPGVEPSGWAFEFENPYYADVDDTAMVLLALNESGHETDPVVLARAVRWLLAFQCKDGGWAAFDKDVQNPLLENVPFADHNAILDPSCCDVTARALEALGKLGFRISHPAIANGIKFLKRQQEPDGAWFGRWGVNYIYGTSQVLRGLLAVGADMSEPWIQKGRTWLEEHQNADGGWGETVASYDEPLLRGQGTTTASQTAWALLGLCAFPDVERRSVREGIEYLVSNQNPDGSWSETLITGTGFPLVFYLKYDMYRNNWPLMALARYQTRVAEAASRPVEREEVLHDRRRSEDSFASTRSSFSSLPVFVLLRDLLTKLNHG